MRVYFAYALRAALLLFAISAIVPAGRSQAAVGGIGNGADACGKVSARECATLALEAMGGRERLESIKNIRLEVVGHTELMEQSYRQDPFITAYSRRHDILDLAGQRLLRNGQSTWPESDLGKSESQATLIVGLNGGVYHGTADRPCSIGDIDNLRQSLALGPARLMLTALAAADLRYEKSEVLRSTPHTVLAFTWGNVPVKILINSFNRLPDAVETVQAFHDFWTYWGDVRQRIDYDNWMLIHGVVYPTNAIEERNGAIWDSKQAVNVEFNVALDEKEFAMDEKATQQSLHSTFFAAIPFHADSPTVLAPGIDLFVGPWNATIIQQNDGIVILESPMSGVYTQGVIDKAKQMHPGAEIKAVLSTSDSWPHVGGVRQDVADALPVYILDLNRPLLERFVNEPRTLNPDALSESPKNPDWKIVSGKTVVGAGDNRAELYPLRGAGTERQYMVYFPARKILYASDTLVVNGDGTLYDPELTYEVVQAAKREGLDVTTVFAMHQAPIPWTQVLALIEKAKEAAAGPSSEDSQGSRS